MRHLAELLEPIAPWQVTVTIPGESGTGKAATQLGLSRTSLFERMMAWGLSDEGQEAR